MRAFIVRPFGVKNDIDFDEVEKVLIDPVLTRLGVTGRTTGEVIGQGNIREDMFQLLLTADLVVADLSIHNANVFYELGDLIPHRGEGDERKPIPLSEDLGRQFLYARYNAELSEEWLAERGLGKINPADVSKLDSVEYVPDLVRVGKALAKEVKLEHFALERFGQFY